MRNVRNIVLLAVCLMSMALSANAAPKWEQVGTEIAIEATDENYVSVEVRNGCIYVTTAQPVEVKVFSIVGQLISQAKLEPGISRLKMNSRGLYIVKIGEKTLRVTL